ncbi:ferredoxin [Candidatus Woesearchaeota archaeon]|nr:ferredoxin [Candidatus Woesearchaeota archaeon]
MGYKVTVDKNECIGCGACEAQCPEGFEINQDEAKANPKKAKVNDLGCIKEAADICPVNAIKIEEE